MHNALYVRFKVPLFEDPYYFLNGLDHCIVVQADAVKDFQGHLISKASEVDQLRVDLQNMEVVNFVYEAFIFFINLILHLGFFL